MIEVHKPTEAVEFGLAIFTLTEAVEADDITPICLPLGSFNLALHPDLDHCQDVDEEQKNIYCDDEAKCLDFASEVRMSGRPLADLNQFGKYSLTGIRVNSCPSKIKRPVYIDVTAFKYWLTSYIIEEANFEVDTIVDGLCPLVRKVSTSDHLTCDKVKGYPGFVNGTSKVPCDQWNVVAIDEATVILQCNDYEAVTDGEVVILAKSHIMCRLVNCLEDDLVKDKVSLDLLTDCPTASDFAQTASITSEAENGCFIFSSSQMTTTTAEVVNNDETTEEIVAVVGSLDEDKEKAVNNNFIVKRTEAFPSQTGRKFDLHNNTYVAVNQKCFGIAS